MKTTRKESRKGKSQRWWLFSCDIDPVSLSIYKSKPVFPLIGKEAAIIKAGTRIYFCPEDHFPTSRLVKNILEREDK